MWAVLNTAFSATGMYGYRGNDRSYPVQETGTLLAVWNTMTHAGNNEENENCPTLPCRRRKPDGMVVFRPVLPKNT